MIGYAVYLFQAATLHAFRSVTEKRNYPGHLLMSVVSVFICAGMMVYFAAEAMVEFRLAPFE